MKIGSGIFGWSSYERQSDRYGSFGLGSEPFDKPACIEPQLDLKALQGLQGKRVKVTVKVIETRSSGHAGDRSHGIFPVTPELGETIELGVGRLDIEPNQYADVTGIVLRPEDGREVFWIDPYKLYRLHDQTVEVFAEETTEPCHSAPVLGQASEEAINNGDGSYQVKTRRSAVRVLPNFERIGDGLFSMSPIGVGGAGMKHRLG